MVRVFRVGQKLIIRQQICKGDSATTGKKECNPAQMKGDTAGWPDLSLWNGSELCPMDWRT
jgi:hypothetical protein